MNREALKAHSFYLIIIIIITGIVLFFVYLFVVSLYLGFEELGMGDVWFFVAAVLYSIGWGFAAVVIAYQVLYQCIKGYVGERRRIVPRVCFECDASLHPDDVKWIGKDMAECPYCGVSLKVPIEWF